jgi:hypothetical protein
MAYMRQGIVVPAPSPFTPVHRGGLSSYRRSGDWTWEFYPPPYDFLAPRDSVAMSAPVVYSVPGHNRGIGCSCGGHCDSCRSSGAGLGLFDSGLDLTQWGIGEWAAVAGGVYLLSKLLGDVKRVRKVAKRRKGRSKAIKRQEQILKRLRES